MIPVSTVPAAIAALTAQIETAIIGDTGAADGSPIQVVTGEESTDAPDDLIIVATDVHRTVRPETMIGDYSEGSLKETYVIDVMCSSWSGDSDPIANMNRAWTLVSYVESAVRTDPSLGTTILECHPAGSTGGQSFWSEPPTIGRQTDITVAVAVMTLN